MKQTMFSLLLLIVLLGFPYIIVAEPNNTSELEMPDCDPKCGCVEFYIYDEVKDVCVVNMQKLMKTVLVRYDNKNDDAILSEDGMAKSIYIEGQKLFRGIMISVILFITCATVCALSACIYCCKINYSDRKLKNEVKALAKRMHKKYDSTKRSSKSKEAASKSESCNVVVEEAGIFVV